jgi:hypothetical protein
LELIQVVQKGTLAVDEQRGAVLVGEGGDGDFFAAQDAILVVEMVHAITVLC